MNAGRLARLYRWLEYAAFGRLLERCRSFHLPQMVRARRVIILGEGDGRFLARFLASNGNAYVDVVEQSQRMIALARSRLEAGDTERVRFLAVDAGAVCLPHTTYDLAVAHFFFDCFEDEHLRQLLRGILPSIAPDAAFVVSEFHTPETGLARWHARVWIGVMYLFFRWTTGLAVRRIPSYEAALVGVGFVLQDRREWRWGLIRAECFVRRATATKHMR